MMKDAGSLMRSDRLLRGMHKVFSHDLPNQMVALQSLLQMLSADEAGRLSMEGQEYVRRLHSASLRACEQVRFLKEMGRINSCTAKAEAITLSTLARELQGELQQKHPHTEFTFDWQWETASIVGDVRTLRLALSELFTALMGPNAGQCRVSASARSQGNEIILTFQLQERRAAWTEQALEQRMEIVLAREWLALSAANLEVTLPAEGTVCFLISIPNAAGPQIRNSKPEIRNNVET
jgi:light-regulated signal transduction histidine kinase (bacteriophytochrome)